MAAQVDGGAVTTGVLALALAATNGWWLTRQAREARKPADADAAFKGYKELVDQLRTDIARLRADHAADLTEMRAELGDCHHNHSLAMREVNELRGEIAVLRAKMDRPPEARTRSTDE